jgi:hypothetical protein
LEGVPDCLEIYVVVLMSQPVTDASDFRPRHSRTSSNGGIAEPNGRLADDQQLALHGSDCFRVLAERLEIHTCSELVDVVDGVGDVAK